MVQMQVAQEDGRRLWKDARRRKQAAPGVQKDALLPRLNQIAGVLTALPVCLLAEIVVYGKDYWKPKWQQLFYRAKEKNRVREKTEK